MLSLKAKLKNEILTLGGGDKKYDIIA